MDGNCRARKSQDDFITMEHQRSPGDVVISISREKDALKFPASDKKHEVALASPQNVSFVSPVRGEKSGDASPTNRPPKIPSSVNLTTSKRLSRSIFSKPKSRFGEQMVLVDNHVHEQNEVAVEGRVPSNRGSPRVDGDLLVTSETPNRLSNRVLDEHEEIYKKVKSKRKLKYRKVKVKVLIEWLLFLCVLGCLVATLFVGKLQKLQIWGLSIWKWFVLVLVIFSGLLVTRWLMTLVVLLIELNFLLRKRVLYFVYGLKTIVQVFIWLAVVLLTWILLFTKSVESPTATRILDFITWSIGSLLIGSFLWLLKTLLLKILASTFHVNTFFDRIQEATFHQYILLTLSGPPVMESEQMLGRTFSNTNQLNVRITKKGKEGSSKEKRVIDISKLHEMKQEKVSAWTMKMLVDLVSNSGLTTISTSIEESFYNGRNEQTDKEITNEEEAIAAAYDIFMNVARPGRTYVDQLDFERFMLKEEAGLVFPMIDVTESGKIDRKCLTDWVLKAYTDRKTLAHALNDTKTAVKQLNKLISGILVVVTIILWLLLTGIATTKIIVFLSSQFILVAFMFGNTCKTIFEAIIFVFVMHPFDVGDRCVVDGVQMVVEEMNILTTVFLRYDNEKIYYPNYVLASKPISNFHRSPDMSDSLEFSIAFSTSMEKIGSLKEKIKKYLETNPQHWHPNHNLVVKEIEDVNKIKMVLYFNHTMNFQDIGEKNRRRTDLVLELKKIFEELFIRYDLLPQQIHLSDH